MLRGKSSLKTNGYGYPTNRSLLRRPGKFRPSLQYYLATRGLASIDATKQIVGFSKSSEMLKPLPKDFQLTDSDLLILPHEREALEKYNERVNNKLGHAVFLTVYAILVGVLWSSIHWFALCGALPASFIAALIFWEKGDAIMRRFNRKPSDALKRYEAFRFAVAQYDLWLLRTQEEFWNSLSGEGFEIEVLQLLNRAGFRAQLTGGAGDGGVDIVLDDGTIIQCKAHAGPCGPSVLRELFGSLHHFGAEKAILISRGGFTTGSLQFVEGKPITLWDRHDLIRLQRNLE
jgi:hypothetical protein